MSSQNNGTSKTAKAAGARAPPALDPRAPALIQPYKRLVEEGFITALCVSFSPTGVTCTCKVDARVHAADEKLVVGVEYPVALVARVADEKNLVPKPGKNKKNAASGAPAPKKSLRKEDFESASTLKKRAEEVAAAVGGSGLLGRIGSGGLTPARTMSFTDWWKEASAGERLRILSSGVHHKVITEAEESAKMSQMLGSLACPFRDKLEIRVSEDAEEAEETAAAKPEGPATAKSSK